jgi:hypothetical protein
MEIVLCEGYGIDMSYKAMRAYLKKSGINAFFYSWPKGNCGEENRECIRIDGNDVPPGEECCYIVSSEDFGHIAPYELVKKHEILTDGLSRTDTALIEVLKELKHDADPHGMLSIATIPDGIEWHIDSDSEYGGEWVVEGPTPRVWYGKPL